MLALLCLLPALAGVMAMLLKADGPRRGLLVGTAFAHLALTGFIAATRPQPAAAGWLAADAAGLLFLGITSVLFAVAAIYAVGYLRREAMGEHPDRAENVFFANAPEAVFTGCLLFFLATMSLVATSQNMGLLWVALEASTLASAPLIYYHRHNRSLEAAWKYLLICSVGIALALLGNFFLALAASGGGAGAPLHLGDLLAHAAAMPEGHLKAAFLLLLVGYGTKMGLAPLHTWLPDAHSEAPSVVSALLSGALLNCAFLGILRAQQVLVAAGLGAFGQQLLVGFGLVSMGVAAAFILGQADYKRLLAYSSVEHMGILALGVGLSGAAAFGAMLHAVNHSLTKAMLFLVAGNILAAFRTKAASDVSGLLAAQPATGVLWLVGLFAIAGFPPFGTFLSEFTILRAALDGGQLLVAALYMALLALIFLGMAPIALEMAQGEPDESAAGVRLGWAAVAPPACLGAAVLVLGLYHPPALGGLLHEAARLLGGS